MTTRSLWSALASCLLSACLLYENGGKGAVPLKCEAERAAADGAACTCSSDCRSEGAVCLDEATTGMPQGLCARQCVNTPDCDPGSVCLSGYCFPGCLSSDECELGRTCEATPGSALTSRGACTYLCDEDRDCQSGTCNPYRGLCMPAGKEPQGSGIAESCGRDADCKSNACLDGACMTRCDPTYQRCPDEALCVEGLCLRECQASQDCLALGTKSCVSLEADSFCL